MKRFDDFDTVDQDESPNDDIFSLSDAIGPRRRNDRADVLKVETLLANSGDHDLENGPTGYAGAGLDTAIRGYQKRRDLAVDGVLEPGGETITALDGELRPRLGGWRAPRPDEADDHFNRVGRGDEPLLKVFRDSLVLHALPELPEIDAETWQSNGRTARALFQTRDNGPLADLAASAIETEGLGPVAEVRDLIEQISAHDSGRARQFASAVFDRLSHEGKQQFAGGEQPEHGLIGEVPLGGKGDTEHSDALRDASARDTAIGAIGADTVGDSDHDETSRAAGGAPDQVARADLESGMFRGAPQPTGPGPRRKNENPLEMVTRPEPQKEKRDIFKKQPGVWEGFNSAVSDIPGVTDAQQFSYGEIFAWEGGKGVDTREGGVTSSGITPEVLKRAKGNVWATGLDTVQRPAQLSIEQRAAIYDGYLNQELKEVGGAGALGDIGDSRSAAALADTPFRKGGGRGVRLIQNAINDVDPKRVGVDGHLGPGTLDAYADLARNPETRGQLLDALAKQRKDAHKDIEEKRIDYFRYRDER